MGWTYIGGADNSGSGSDTTIATSSTLNVATGDLLVAIVRWDGADTTVSIQSGASENEFTMEATEINDSQAFGVVGGYVLEGDANATATITATFGAARTYRWIIVLQFRPDSGETVSKDAGPAYNERSDDYAESGDVTTTGTDVVCVGMEGVYSAGTIFNSNVTFDGNAATGTYSEAPADAHAAYYIGTMSNGSFLVEFVANEYSTAFVLCFKSEAAGGEAYERTVTDTVGLADTLTTARNLAKSVSDPVGMTDTVATARTLPRSIADALGITDSVNALKKLVRTISDAIGLTDTLSTKRGLSRTVSDPAAATDSIATARELARTFAETADITDDISTSRSIVKTISDTLGITDVLSRARGFFRTITDALGITDSIAAEVTEYTPGESDIVLLSGSIGRRVSLSGGIEREIDSSGRIARTVRIAGTLR